MAAPPETLEALVRDELRGPVSELNKLDEVERRQLLQDQHDERRPTGPWRHGPRGRILSVR